MNENRQQVMRIAKTILGMDPIYIDTETTGFNPLDVVVEIGILDSDGSVLYESLVKPKKPIPQSAAAVHGITDAKVAWSPDWEKVWPEIVQVVSGRIAGFYNAEFDLKMIRQSCGLNGIPWEYPFEDDFCVMELFARYFGEWDARKQGYRWKNLAFAGKYFRIPEPNSHRASDDALLAKLVMEKMAEGAGGEF